MIGEGGGKEFISIHTLGPQAWRFWIKSEVRSLTINVPLILKVRDIIFFEGKIYNGYAQDNLGVKKVSAPSKNPKKGHIICFAPEKKNPGLLKSEVHWYFYVPKSER